MENVLTFSVNIETDYETEIKFSRYLKCFIKIILDMTSASTFGPDTVQCKTISIQGATQHVDTTLNTSKQSKNGKWARDSWVRLLASSSFRNWYPPDLLNTFYSKNNPIILCLCSRQFKKSIESMEKKSRCSGSGMYCIFHTLRKDFYIQTKIKRNKLHRIFRDITKLISFEILFHFTRINKIWRLR